MNFTELAVTAGITGLLLGIKYMMGDTKGPSVEISWQQFKTELLLRGEVERIEVVNNDIARVVLVQDTSDKSEEHGEVFDIDQGNGNSGEISSSNSLDLSNRNTKFYFTIGSVGSLEKKLEKAQV